MDRSEELLPCFNGELLKEIKENVEAVLEDMQLDVDNFEENREIIVETIQNTIKSLHLKCSYKIEVSLSGFENEHVSVLASNFDNEGFALVENRWVVENDLRLTTVVVIL